MISDKLMHSPLLILLEGEEPESFAGEREDVLLLEGELEEDSAEEDGV